MTTPTCPNGQHYYQMDTDPEVCGWVCVRCGRRPEKTPKLPEPEPECQLCHDGGNRITEYPCECDKDRWR